MAQTVERVASALSAKRLRASWRWGSQNSERCLVPHRYAFGCSWAANKLGAVSHSAPQSCASESGFQSASLHCVGIWSNTGGEGDILMWYNFVTLGSLHTEAKERRDMERVIPVLVVLAIGGTWYLFLYKSSNGRLWSPLWMAFGTTASAVVLIVAGVIGYALDRRAAFFAGTPWSDSVIWWQVAVGLALLPLAALSFRKATLQAKHSSP
jgi:hypothetical protein